jgi:uncharacterized protein YajQ (UPF0234 family)
VSPEFRALAEKSEKALVEFLRAEVALGLTYAQTAKVELGFDAECEKRARELAKDAVITIRCFRDRIVDRSIRLEIQASADTLEKILFDLHCEP